MCVCLCLCVLLSLTGAPCVRLALVLRVANPVDCVTVSCAWLRAVGVPVTTACFCVVTRIHTPSSPCVGRESRGRVGGVMQCCCFLLLLFVVIVIVVVACVIVVCSPFCCVASCFMPMFLLLLLLHRWPRCCPARHVEACRGWSGWVRLLHP